MLRTPILALARNARAKQLVERAPISRGIVARFVAGDDVDAAVDTCLRLAGAGLAGSLDHLGEDTTDKAQADASTEAYLVLLERLANAGLTTDVEVSVKLTAVGLDVDPELGLANARRIADAAAAVGTTATIDMEDHTRTDATLAGVATLRQTHPDVGAVVQAYLRRTEADCTTLSRPGSRVRLCKGAYDEPAQVAFRSREDVSASYERCLRLLMAGEGYPMVATHDPVLIALAEQLVAEHARAPDTYEFQLLYGIRPQEQERLAAAGHRVRIYIPYGTEWFGYLMRRLAERPANVTFFLRALASRS